MPANVVIECSHTLKNHNLKIAFAESVTAGKVISEFALIPNCGSALAGSIVSYDAEVKKTLLKVPAELIEQFSAESEQVTEQMAIGLKQLIPADIVVAVTGLAAPGGSETEEKPVGTMFIHGFYHSYAFSKRVFFQGDPEQVIMDTVSAIAELVITQLKKHGKEPSFEESNC
ncbi:nicotinamide-nucleotide amidohydrolase family protein [Mucilaginibacter sp. RS28]|uniref:Nicotinamide-nucleotide amidohydrolase family protein n=1 Tax=Mucilaginibacter straminoryzae TaxID=2932774 RepID=A0A9X1X2N0_9SPHI|nr:nicotinamide-nucleotide amidohydrolase family protein [Mucilaginibacter straminoryzae]MCJ8208870.1 nicotinamide-nucleotide amidohydrolase family protein [Mucilaginibacter straminoryzae]